MTLVRSRPRKWTDSEDDIIRNNSSYGSVGVLAERFGCTQYQIRDRRRILRKRDRNMVGPPIKIVIALPTTSTPKITRPSFFEENLDKLMRAKRA